MGAVGNIKERAQTDPCPYHHLQWIASVTDMVNEVGGGVNTMANNEDSCSCRRFFKIFCYVDCWTPEVTLRAYGIWTIIVSVVLLIIHITTNALDNLYFYDAVVDLVTILVIGLNGTFMLYQSGNLDEIKLWWYLTHGVSTMGLIVAHISQFCVAFVMFGSSPTLAAWFVIVKSCILCVAEPWLYCKILRIYSAKDGPYTSEDCFCWWCCPTEGQPGGQFRRRRQQRRDLQVIDQPI